MPQWILQILAAMITNASPEIRENIKSWLDDLAAKAKETPNPVDDMLVAGLKILLGA